MYLNALPVTILFLCTLASVDSSLKIGAFNIKWLTWSKVNDPDVLRSLKLILPRYDVVLIQEVRGDADSIAEKLVRELNSQQNASVYVPLVSSKVGRTNYKEQYIFLYRLYSLSVRSASHFDDGSEELGTDLFEREPYILVAHSDNTRVKDFAIIGLHAKPEDVSHELARLGQVVDDTCRTYRIENVIIAGDLNADCSYLSASAQAASPLFTNSSYTWLIDRGSDTTVGANTCAYDRFIITGYRVNRYLISGSVQAYNFREAQSLTVDQAHAVSDHYPIEMELE
ncbi:deoxyribonuclease-1-like [Liolophura sinensis]|uniref:deoxyribonuclease-1-like n=1 Tax=Liolophura sinensis TaxID=3198878 RepID=UPI0031585152